MPQPMTTEDRSKTPRTLLVADHLWEAFTAMAMEMGSERDALVNQALYAFARQHGFLGAEAKRPAFAGHSPDAAAAGPRAVPEPREERPARPMPNPERIAEIAQQLGTPSPWPPTPPPATTESVLVDGSLFADESQATHLELPELRPGASRSPVLTPPPPEPDDAGVRGDGVLVLLSDGRELDRVAKDRFLIGRGKHCDLIINSSKVSREHAVILREGGTWFIEDLGSSNGTWFDKHRISRRRIEDGDEYFICSEKLSCALR